MAGGVSARPHASTWWYRCTPHQRQRASPRSTHQSGLAAPRVICGALPSAPLADTFPSAAAPVAGAMERSESCVERARLLGDIGEVTPNVEPPGRFEAGLRIKNTDTLECSARVIDDSRWRQSTRVDCRLSSRLNRLD